MPQRSIKQQCASERKPVRRARLMGIQSRLRHRRQSNAHQASQSGRRRERDHRRGVSKVQQWRSADESTTAGG